MLHLSSNSFISGITQKSRRIRKAFSLAAIKLLLPDIDDETDKDFNDCIWFHFLNIFKLSIKQCKININIIIEL